MGDNILIFFVSGLKQVCCHFRGCYGTYYYYYTSYSRKSSISDVGTVGSQ